MRGLGVGFGEVRTINVLKAYGRFIGSGRRLSRVKGAKKFPYR